MKEKFLVIKGKQAMLNKEINQQAKKKEMYNTMNGRHRRQHIFVFCNKVFNVVIIFSCFIMSFILSFLSCFSLLQRNCLMDS